MTSRFMNDVSWVVPNELSIFSGVHLVAIGSGTARMAMDFKQKQNFAGQIYVDPSRTIYDDLNCKRGWKAVRKTLNEISSIADLTYF
jgi:uroporphyrinogen-III synthase